MPDDPFAGMTDTFQDRKERGGGILPTWVT